jgi:hypothetical protein
MKVIGVFVLFWLSMSGGARSAVLRVVGDEPLQIVLALRLAGMTVNGHCQGRASLARQASVARASWRLGLAGVPTF